MLSTVSIAIIKYVYNKERYLALQKETLLFGTSFFFISWENNTNGMSEWQWCFYRCSPDKTTKNINKSLFLFFLEKILVIGSIFNHLTLPKFTSPPLAWCAEHRKDWKNAHVDKDGLQRRHTRRLLATSVPKTLWTCMKEKDHGEQAQCTQKETEIVHTGRGCASQSIVNQASATLPSVVCTSQQSREPHSQTPLL